MAKTVRTSGDYTIKAGDGYNSGSGTNTINLDSLNVSITGNLEVGGTSSTISTTNTVIEDNIIELQTGISASTNDSGIIIERGSTGNNACIIWDESSDTFKLGTTTATGADKSGGITVTAGALEVAALTATTGTFSGAITSTGNFVAGQVTTNEITANGSNAAVTVASSGTGDININSGGDIVLDADGADIKLEDDGTEFGRISRITSDLVIKSMGDNNDIIFKGLDDSATINALTLDMSEAGAATFNSTVTATDITANSLTTNEIASNGSNADINITPQGTGKVVINNLSIDGELGNITTDSSNMDISLTPHGTGGIRIPDDIQLHFGNEGGSFGDLQIWHDAGAHSYIRDQGSGDIRIRSSGVDIRADDDSRSIARFDDNGMTVESLTIQDNIISSASNGDIEISPSGTGKVVINNLSIDGELGNITSDSSNMDITVTPHGTGDFRVDGHIGMKVQAGDAAADGDHAHIYAKDDTGSAEVYVRDEAGNVTKLSPHNRQGNWEYFSRNVITGKVVRIDMEKMVRKLEELTGERFIENA